MHGAELLRAIQEQLAATGNAASPLPAQAPAADSSALPITGAEAFGLGGEAMRAAGCELTVEARNVAVVGLAEVVSHLPGIYREFHRLLAEVDRRRPDVAVLIDFPDWNFRLARQLHRRGIPVVYYISPQLWAWRKSRLKLVQRYVDAMLVIFPFEEVFYARHGVHAEFVGHPLTELALPTISRQEFASRWGLAPARQWIALLPGSRRKELRLNLPAILGAARGLGPEYEFILPVASTLDEGWVREQIELAAGSLPADSGAGGSGGSNSPTQAQRGLEWATVNSPLKPKEGLNGPPRPAVHLCDDARAALFHSRAAVVASGTATVEAALIGTPFVMVYRVAPLTWTLGRHLVKLPHYGMVNLVAGRRVVPELIQHDFTPESVERELRPLLVEGDARSRMIAAFAELRAALAGASTGSATAASSLTASQRAARAVLRVAESALRKRE
jgi:lipid-A-disaccharide synthase